MVRVHKLRPMPKSASVVAAVLPGRRETNKQEKLTRIRCAARDVFLRKGFESATVREIAEAADVAFGTLFLYARDKQDLLLLLFDEELPALVHRAFIRAKSDLNFIDQLVAFFEECYAFFNRTPQLSRDMLREIVFGGGIVAARIWAGNQDVERHIARIVARAQANGVVSPSIAPDLAAHVIFSLWRIEIRFCMNEAEPDIAASLQKLRRQLEVVFKGLQAQRADAVEDTSSTNPRKRLARSGNNV